VGGSDIYVSVAGGARATEPAADLAICLAIASSCWRRPVPPDLVAVGEVGLGGEIRRVGAMAKRLAEAKRLGFDRALCQSAAPTLRRALSLAFGEGFGEGFGLRYRGDCGAGAALSPGVPRAVRAARVAGAAGASGAGGASGAAGASGAGGASGMVRGASPPLKRRRPRLSVVANDLDVS